MQKYLLILLILSVNSAHADSLRGALESMVKTNPDILSAQKLLDIADSEDSKAYSGFKPSINGFYSHSRNQLQDNAVSNDQYYNIEQYGVTASQNIFESGAGLAKVQYNSNIADKYRLEYQQIKQSVTLQAINSYFTLQNALERYQLQKSNLKLVEKLYKKVRTRYKSGVATKGDLSQAKSLLATAQADLLSADTHKQSAQADYKRIFGTKGDALITTEIPDAKYTDHTKKQLVDIALKNNISHKIKQLESNIANYNITMQRAKMLPRADISASATQYDNDRTQYNSDEYNVKLTVNIPMYNSGLNYQGYSQSKSQHQQAEAALQASSNNVISQVTSGYYSYKNNGDNISAFMDIVRASKIALTSITIEYENNKRSFTDILNQQQEYLRAQLALADAKRNHILSYYQLLAYLGEL